MYFLHFIWPVVSQMKSYRRLTTPRRPRKKRYGKRKSYGQKASPGRTRRRLFKQKRRKQRRRAGKGLRNDGNATVVSFGSNRKLKKWDKPLLYGLPFQKNSSTYVFRDKQISSKNQQSITQLYFYTFPNGGLPTVDPGVAGGNFLAKVWFDQTGNATGSNTRPILHYGCDSQLTIKSASETPMEINIYHCITRKDHNQAAVSIWDTGLKDTFRGYADSYANAQPAVSTLGVTPFNSTPFCQHYKILKNTRVTLGPGETHRAYIKQKVMKKVDASDLKITQLQYRKGWTYLTLIVARGLTASDGEGDVGVPGVKYTYEIKSKFNWKIVNELNRDQIYYYDNSVLQTGIGPMRDVNEETGQVDAQLDFA